MRGFGGGMGGLMAQAQKMQAKIAKVQEEIAAMEMLQDLIQLAFNSAQTRLSEISEERMRKEVPLPPGMKLPF